MSIHNSWPTGPPKDPHFFPVYKDAPPPGTHFQATAQQAAERGWFYRTEWYQRLVPDTRRCFECGEIVFEPLPLTEAEANVGYLAADKGMAT